MRRTLVLKKEILTELSTDDLALVAGGALATTGCPTIARECVIPGPYVTDTCPFSVCLCLTDKCV